MPNKAKKILKETVAGFVGATFLTESMPLAARRKEHGFKCETYVRLATRLEDITWLLCFCGMIGKCYAQRDKRMEVSALIIPPLVYNSLSGTQMV